MRKVYITIQTTEGRIIFYFLLSLSNPDALRLLRFQALPLITELSNGGGANRKPTHVVDLANLATAENTSGLCWPKKRHPIITSVDFSTFGP